MRLLKRISRPGSTIPEYILTEFSASRIPADYAILSHRWGEEEVTYKDLETGTARTKSGYRKLEFCAEQAAEHGIVHFWVDTCCIDKANFTELSEAINSMYKWYHKATKCYVYMPDVSLKSIDGGSLAEHEWKATFRSSNWFTRGWTLQELIAPSIVEFFSVEVARLGDKSTLEKDIHDVTGIPVDALRGNVMQFDLEKRLSWAATRQTTVEEDAAYCLFGIVDIHLPLIYGEGRQKAMARLRRELQSQSRSSEDATESNALVITRPHTVTSIKTVGRQAYTIDQQNRNEFLKSLSYPEMEYRYFGVTDVEDDTCDWLLKHDKYQEWHGEAASSSILIVRGKPGSGKSTAMKMAYTSAKTSACADEGVIAFFFNSRGAAMEAKLEGFFRSMLHQLFETRYCADEEVLAEWERKTTSIASGWTWTVTELRRMFIRCIRDTTYKITIFVDALDECESTTAAHELMDLLSGLGQAGDPYRPRTKICVSSRHYPNIGISEPLQIVVEDTNSPAIARYTVDFLKRLGTGFEDLSERVASRAQGIFLWAALVLEKIRVAAADEPRRSLYKIVEAVPRRLEDLFRELLDCVPHEQREDRDLIFLWVLYAERPLTLSELGPALAFCHAHLKYEDYETSDEFVRPDETARFLASRTRGLVEAVGSSGGRDSAASNVQFIHESVRQYILSPENVSGSSWSWSDSGFAHNLLASSCFNFLKAAHVRDDRDETADKLAMLGLNGHMLWYPLFSASGFPFGRNFMQRSRGKPIFQSYASRFCLHHASLAEASGYPQSIHLKPIQGTAEHVSAWWSNVTEAVDFPRYDCGGRNLKHLSFTDRVWLEGKFKVSKDWSKRMNSRLAYACAFRLDSWVTNLLADDQFLPGRLETSQALCVTAAYGSEETLAALIQSGADIDYCELDLGSPLYLAILYGRSDMIKSLVAVYGANTKLRCLGIDLLVTAVVFGTAEDVRFLLAHGVKVDDGRVKMRGHPVAIHAVTAATYRDVARGSNQESQPLFQRTVTCCQSLVEGPDISSMYLETTMFPTSNTRSQCARIWPWTILSCNMDLNSLIAAGSSAIMISIFPRRSTF